MVWRRAAVKGLEVVKAVRRGRRQDMVGALIA